MSVPAAPAPASAPPGGAPVPVVLRERGGGALPLDARRWHGAASAAEVAMLEGLGGPVLDVGCGPGRLLEGLARRGVPALGVDVAPAAVRRARERGGVALVRSVFAPLPGEGRWRTIALLDGNVGIGGDPVRLLRRCRALAAPTGAVVTEVQRPGTGWRACDARLEGGGRPSAWFRWSVVGADAVGALAAAAGLAVRTFERVEDRWFAHLVPAGVGRVGA